MRIRNRFTGIRTMTPLPLLGEKGYLLQLHMDDHVGCSATRPKKSHRDRERERESEIHRRGRERVLS